jgi:hypothetical protein
MPTKIYVCYILGRAQIFCARAQWQSSRLEKNGALALALRPKK